MSERWLAHANDLMNFRVTPDGQFAAIYHRKQAYEDGKIQFYDLNNDSKTTIPRHPDL